MVEVPPGKEPLPKDCGGAAGEGAAAGGLWRLVMENEEVGMHEQ